MLDPVHGLIRMTEEELQIVNSRLFQRLRRIKQNGLLNYVFPSASHSRFEHSLGVLFVADSMLHALVCNGQVASAKSPSELGTEPMQAVDLERILDRTKMGTLFRIVRLAALCHDLGHGPLSHTFDKFAPTRDAVAELLSGSDSAVLNRLGDAISRDPTHRIKHEWMSCVLFAALFQSIDAKDQTTVLAVAASILNKPELVSDPELRKLVPLVNDLIASAPADADRMDYVERDSRSCGVSYGLFDRNRVLKSFLAYFDNDRQLRLGIKSSGFRAIENFIQARFELFVQIYYHKTNRAIELMLSEIGTLAEKNNSTIMRESSLEELFQDYAAIGDDEFVDVLTGRRDLKFEGAEQIHTLGRAVGERRLWRRIEDFREALIPAARQKDFYEELRAEYPDVELMMDQVKPKATKDLDGGAALLFRGDDGIYRPNPRHSWMSISPLIRSMTEEEKHVVRIYYKGSDPTIAKRLRMAALKLENRFRP